MFYSKSKITDSFEIKIDLYDDEIYTRCGKCSKELKVNTETLREILKDGDLCSTTIYCEKCSKLLKD